MQLSTTLACCQCSGSVTFGYGYVRIILVSNVVKQDPHHFGNLDPHPDPHPHQIKKLDPYSEPHQIKFRIRIRVRIRVRITIMSWIRSRIRINIHFVDDKPKCMEYEHISRFEPLEARISIQIRFCIRVKSLIRIRIRIRAISRIRIRIKVMQIHNTACIRTPDNGSGSSFLQWLSIN